MRGEPGKRKYVLAAWIRSDDPQADGAKAGEKASKEKEKKKEKAAGAAAKPSPLNVIYVGDIDLLHSEFLRMRNEPNTEVTFRFDNVPLALNIVDAVAGDNRFLEIRKRKPRHSTLQRIERRAADARGAEDEEKKKFETEYDEAVKKADEKAKKNYEELQKIVDELNRKRSVGEAVDPIEFQEKLRDLQIKQQIETRRAEVEKQRLQIDRDKKLARIQRERDQSIQRIQNEYKVQATFIPVIPPLLVGLVVWARRRVREREGVSRDRMKTT
jgi:ABC-2 type transport system permease protein